MTYIYIKLSFLIIFLSAFKDVHLYFMYSLTVAKKNTNLPPAAAAAVGKHEWNMN